MKQHLTLRRRRRVMTLALAGRWMLIVAVILSGCARTPWQAMGPPVLQPTLEADHIIAADGYRLPLRSWLPEGEPRGIVLALHGFNDYGKAFSNLEPPLVAEKALALYAYDQRGFGGTAHRGLWAGTPTLVRDLHTAIALLRQRHEDLPLYLMGESMGAALILLALAEQSPPAVDGAVLLAPAVWARHTMPWYQRLGLWLGVRLIPTRSFSAENVRRLGVRASDDREVMRELVEDPLVLNEARVDTLYGTTLLMDEAARVSTLPVPALVLYGDNDQVVPPAPVCRWLGRLQPQDGPLIALYPDGYHMLTRYTGRAQVIADVQAWLAGQRGSPGGRLPSGHGMSLVEATARVCDL